MLFYPATTGCLYLYRFVCHPTAVYVTSNLIWTGQSPVVVELDIRRDALGVSGGGTILHDKDYGVL